VAYGYRILEVPLPELPEIKPSCSFSKIRMVDLEVRPPIAVSLGCHLKGYAQPEPDPADPYTMVAGVCKRFACKPPNPFAPKLTRLGAFVEKFVRANFTPLHYATDTSVDTWLLATDYPYWRKCELKAAWEKVDNIWNEKYHVCKSFMKDETYGEYKYPRGINSRRDEFKCFVGPIFKLIESVVYNHPSFIKHVPVASRPNYIMNKLYNATAKYFATDYTAFESLFTRELMEHTEFILYDYMTKDLPQHEEFMRACREVIGGLNKCDYKHFSVEIEATRMSGEMNTSLGNGFANLMIMLFLCEEVGSISCDGVVEGDDGLFAISGPAPCKQDFENLGLRIKLEEHSDISTASFCGIIFDPQDRNNLVDPRKVIQTFGWACGKYVGARDKKLRALLRCKALSLVFQYPGCPIVQALGEYGLRVTAEVKTCELLRTVNAKGYNSYHRGREIKSLTQGVTARVVGLNTRLLCEKVFGISVECQLDYERYLNSLTHLTILEPRQMTTYMHVDCQDYSSRYVMAVPADIRRPRLSSRQKFEVEEVLKVMGRNSAGLNKSA
jgi:hypothetical protein